MHRSIASALRIKKRGKEKVKENSKNDFNSFGPCGTAHVILHC